MGWQGLDSGSAPHLFRGNAVGVGTQPVAVQREHGWARYRCLRFAGAEGEISPATANADIWWCQGFSEPEAGSDLASLKTAAVRDGADYIVNGQKTWTTLAQHAEWIFCLVRTDASAQKRQAGISFLLIDLATPGITVRPIKLIDGSVEVNEVFFDNVPRTCGESCRRGEQGLGLRQVPARQRTHGGHTGRVLQNPCRHGKREGAGGPRRKRHTPRGSVVRGSVG